MFVYVLQLSVCRTADAMRPPAAPTVGQLRLGNLEMNINITVCLEENWREQISTVNLGKA